jgi:uncharacterized protein YcfJ
MIHLIASLESRWKKLVWLCPMLLAAVSNSGCQNPNHAESDAVGGGVLGAVGGALIGGALGGGKGAAIGAGAGALAGAATGAVVGNKEDKHEEKVQQAVAQAQADAAAHMLTTAQVVDMVHNHTSDTIIINQIRTSGSVYHLTADDITYLQSQGVSDAVITEMQATASRPYYYPRRVYVDPPPSGVVIYRDPPPPVVVGVGVGGGCYRRW